MSREIRFRAWDKENKTMYDWQTIRQYPIDYTFGSDIVTPMQYTGPHDRNGKDIYEGDICDAGRDTIVQIVWMDTHGWGCKVLKGCVLSMGLTFPLWQWDKCEKNGNRELEVIGNVWENPELLQEVEK